MIAPLEPGATRDGPGTSAWNRFVVFYSAFILYLLTLNPFQFNGYAPSEIWSWQFGLIDFGQNILLFIPFGVIVKQVVRMPALVVLLFGLLLSLSIEAAQLFLIARSSNGVDLISNSIGAWLGAVFFLYLQVDRREPEQAISRQTTVEYRSAAEPVWTLYAPVYLPVSFMLLVHCWTVTMRAATDQLYEWLVLPSLVAGLSLLAVVAASSDASTWRRRFVLSAWAAAATMPIVQNDLPRGLALFLFATLVAQVVSRTQYRSFLVGVTGLLSVGMGASLILNTAWFIDGQEGEWNVADHLRWIELFASTAALLSCGLWAVCTFRRPSPALGEEVRTQSPLD